MENIKKNYKSIVIFLVIAGGLLVLVYLVGKQQLFKSKAEAEINTVINITGGGVKYEGNKTFRTNSKRINIEMDPQKLENW